MGLMKLHVLKYEDTCPRQPFHEQLPGLVEFIAIRHEPKHVVPSKPEMGNMHQVEDTFYLRKATHNSTEGKYGRSL